ncbi:carbamoyltransferase family protein [Candidatus Thioglobus autotrophicus]|uniref:carbamoyltransferase family protein n=1 Tax=Candidatus Thioglobus autotrophicus TaxID=1705394 RepID=UPI00299E7948|nr:carbamoyltransferase [Candidatus Thioglobus autotrophicus]WPE17775.1 carbamoyltransferase [Candidatus Thioglobus autotrophicus]
MTAVLGISAFYHDSAAALIVDGEIIAAAQEERFTRKKHDPSYPVNAIDYCLSEVGLSLEKIDYIAFYDKPFLKFERLLETYVAFAPKGFQSFRMAMPVWLREKLFLKDMLIKEIKKVDKNFDSNKLMFGEHHFSHAASAFYASPFEEAVVITLDGVGEWATTTVAIGKGHELDIVKEIHFPHSLGLLYSAFTYYTGFRVNSGEYKVMGLAPYGEPKYKDLILDKLIDLKEDGSFRLDQSYFNYATGLTMVNQKFADLFGEPVRKPDTDKLTQFHMDIAASVQAVTEEVVLTMTRALANEYNIPNLCMAGGVALNCVANGKILRDKAFKDIWIQPASGDAGGALGGALAVWHKELSNPRVVNPNDAMQGSYLGPSYEQDTIEAELTKCGAKFESVSEGEMIEQTAQALADSKAIGWFQGRMEFGPRSLGGRSILGDPRSEQMQKTLNLKVKYRESFRPFAPSVLREDVSDWFEADYDSPYMLLVDDVKKDKRIEMTQKEESLFGIDKLNIKRSSIPAITHVDYSARIQTVHKRTNPKYHALITKFKEKTGCAVVVNTSFNVRGEPIICTPEDAFKCFMGTELDVLVVGNCFLRKEKQDQLLNKSYKDQYDLD